MTPPPTPTAGPAGLLTLATDTVAEVADAVGMVCDLVGKPEVAEKARNVAEKARGVSAKAERGAMAGRMLAARYRGSKTEAVVGHVRRFSAGVDPKAVPEWMKPKEPKP